MGIKPLLKSIHDHKNQRNPQPFDIKPIFTQIMDLGVDTSETQVGYNNTGFGYF